MYWSFYFGIFHCPVYTYAKHIWHAFIVFHKLTKNVTLVPKGVQHFPGVGVELNCLFPIELVIFKMSPGHLLPPPPPRVRAWLILIVFHVLIMS